MCICQMYMLSGDCSPGFMSPEGIYIRQYYLHSGICTGTRCNYLRTRCFWRRLTINCLQLAQVRRSMSLRRLKNRRFQKICLWVACKAVFAKPSVPRFLHRDRAASATDKLYHTRHFCHTCQFCHFSFSPPPPSSISPSTPTFPLTPHSSSILSVRPTNQKGKNRCQKLTKHGSTFVSDSKKILPCQRNSETGLKV